MFLYLIRKWIKITFPLLLQDVRMRLETYRKLLIGCSCFVVFYLLVALISESNPLDFHLSDNLWHDLFTTKDIQLITPSFVKQGFSRKAIVHYHNGIRGICKLISRNSQLSYQFIHPNSSEKYNLDAGSIHYQGATEIMAFHLDRLMGFNKKPYTLGKIVSKHDWNSESLWQLLSLNQSLGYASISLQQFVDGLFQCPPTSVQFNCLTQKSCPLSVFHSEKRALIQISDILLYDYMLEDYDRNQPKVVHLLLLLGALCFMASPQISLQRIGFLIEEETSYRWTLV